MSLLVCLAEASCAVLALKYATAPYLVIAGCSAIVAFMRMRKDPRDWVRATAFNIGVLSLLLGATEGYFWWLELATPALRYEYPAGYWVRDEILGTAPRPLSSNRVRRLNGDQVIYDVVYTMDRHGLRVTPSVIGTSPVGCVLFFGDSFTFGEGVDDDRTMPYLVGSKSEGRVRALNFGFLGYGPHHMLAALQLALIEQRLDCRPTHLVYQALPHHVARASGLTSFGRHGPRYSLGAQRELIANGHFDDDEIQARAKRSSVINALIDEVTWQLGKSSIYRAIAAREPFPRDEHLDLFLAVVAEARKLSSQKFPGSEFHVLLWSINGQHDNLYGRMIKGLRTHDIPVHLVSDILPGYEGNSAAYEIDPPHERHPNAVAHELLASYVLTSIVGRK